MECAGMILTGGASRRMGTDKASVTLGGRLDGGRLDDIRPETLARRTAALLTRAAAPVIEVGPGRSGLPATSEPLPGTGPLAAMAAGWAALEAGGWDGPVLVVATDLPYLTEGLLTWLATYPDQRSVVPVQAGRAQPLCSRYSPADAASAAALVAAGRRAMRDLLVAIGPKLAGEEEWAGPAGRPDALTDVDTPEQLARVRRGHAGP